MTARFDLFAELWSDLSGNIAETNAAAKSLARRSQRLNALIRYVDGEVARDPFDGARLRGLLAGDHGSEAFRTRLVIAQSIDYWAEPLAHSINPEREPSETHRRVRAVLIRSGRLNAVRGVGQVIPRRPEWGFWSDEIAMRRPVSDPPIADLFANLTVIPEMIAATDPHDANVVRPVALRYRLVTMGAMPKTRGAQVIIGVAPLATDPDDIKVECRSDDGVDWYDVQPKDLSARAEEAIGELCTAGANIIVFPEMTIHEATLNTIARATGRLGPSSDLRLVVAGSARIENGSGRPFNRTTVFNGRGAVLATQDKMACWDLSARVCREYGLTPPSTPSALRHEYITAGTTVTVLDLPTFGRLAVMICEDLNRSQPGEWLRDNMLLDWLITPVMDTGLTSGRWTARAAYRAARNGGCRVVVANSHALTLSYNRYRCAIGAEAIRKCGVALCVDPKDRITPVYRVLEFPTDKPPRKHAAVQWHTADWTPLGPFVT